MTTKKKQTEDTETTETASTTTDALPAEPIVVNRAEFASYKLDEGEYRKAQEIRRLFSEHPLRLYWGPVEPGEIELRHVRTFAVGDVVRLKAGGPRMTVTELARAKDQDRDPAKPFGLDSAAALELRQEEDQARSEDDPATVWCAWFVKLDGAETGTDSPQANWSGPHQAHFRVDILEHAR